MSRANDRLFRGQEEFEVDLSSMIDLVFLLLIFFMTSSTMITYGKDQRVLVPIASHAAVPKLVSDRVIVNILLDGTCYDESGEKKLSLERIERLMAIHKSRFPTAKLHLRADQRVPHHLVKRVVDASRRGGVSQVIFSTYVTGR